MKIEHKLINKKVIVQSKNKRSQSILSQKGTDWILKYATNIHPEGWGIFNGEPAFLLEIFDKNNKWFGMWIKQNNDPDFEINI